MRFVGTAIRYLLNINTIWGVMILTAFALCVAQNYLPTHTVIPGERLHPGENTLAITIKVPPTDKVQTYSYRMRQDGANLLIAAEDQARDKGRPFLLSATPAGSGYVLTWDFDGYGKYELSANGALVKRGTLITFQGLTNTAFDYAKVAFELALGWVASMVLLLGLMKVGEDAGIVQLVARAFHPLIRLIFPGIPKDHPASGAVLMSITTGVLGLANAATPFGLKAMKELQSLNKHPQVATDAQVMLLAWNTGGLAIVPATLIAARKAAGCSNPFEIIGTCLLGGLIATTVAVISAKLLGRLPVFSVRAAAAEGTSPADDAPLVAATAGDQEEGQR